MQTVVISSLLAEALPSGGELWWYCRGLDRAGSGRVVLNFAQAAEELGMAYGTVCRWFKACTNHGLFDVLSRKHGQAVVMMRSLQKVTRYFGVTSLGGCGEVLLSELKNLRYHATDLQVQFSQFCGIFGATEGKGNVEELQRELIDPIFQRSQSRTWGAVKPVEGVTWVGPRCLFVKPDFALGGISQKKIGEALDRDKRTVSRRLSDAVRERRGLITVDRRQIARQDLDTSKAILNQTPAQLMMQGQTEAAMERPKFFGCSGRLWKAEANLYSVPVVLLGRRHWRREVKRAGITPEVPTKKG
jgi:hypothetical protein